MFGLQVQVKACCCSVLCNSASRQRHPYNARCSARCQRHNDHASAARSSGYHCDARHCANACHISCHIDACHVSADTANPGQGGPSDCCSITCGYPGAVSGQHAWPAWERPLCVRVFSAASLDMYPVYLLSR